MPRKRKFSDESFGLAIQNLMAEKDFYEGVRAVVVDKDKKPRWRFSSLAEVSEDDVERYFASLGERELSFS